MTLAAVLALVITAPAATVDVGHPQGVLVGEITHDSAWLQTRCPGGVVAFDLSPDAALPPAKTIGLGPAPASPADDHIVRLPARGLTPATSYTWRLRSGADEESLSERARGTFRTLPGPDGSGSVRFVVVTGMNYHRFQQGYRGADKELGYPALATIRDLAPDFVIFTGDNVYYDTPQEGRARTAEEMRAKWHEQLALPRFHELFAKVPGFWMKDDHDHRFNDCDTSGKKLPKSDLGIRIFREQAPIVALADDTSPTWRTHRLSKDVQLWLVEGRDHRSDNKAPDGPAKTLWGKTQLEWLQRTLLESDAAVKILASPTPMIGPDDAYKRDNHTNPKGFRREGDEFLAWVVKHGLHEKGFVILCGDRHWQYHSAHPSGIQELSCGALVDANSRIGRAPGDPKSTDPEALIRQPFTSPRASGGFLLVETVVEGDERSLRASFLDEKGAVLHVARPVKGY